MVVVPGLKSSDIQLSDMELFRFTGKLRTPLQTARGALDVRESVIIRVDANVAGFDVSGYGEAAPLDGWGEHNLTQVRFELGRLRDMVFAGACADPDDALQRLREPTARFAFSSALLDAIAHARHRPLRHLFDPGAPHRIPVNATIGLHPPDETTRLALAAWDEGFRTLKLKLGDDADVARVASVRNALPDARLRLDANAAWDVDTATRRLTELSTFAIEYVEQPVATIDGLATLRQRVDIPIAADESSIPLEAAHRVVDEHAADVLVLKPAVLGTWIEIIALVEAARSTNIEVVFTSSLDSVVGRTTTAQLAAGVLGGDVTCGLATGWFEHDFGGGGEDRIRDGWLFLGSGNGLGLNLAGG